MSGGVHRLSAAIFLNYNLSDTTDICHKDGICQFRDCWNPEHIFIGTRKENLSTAKKPAKKTNDLDEYEELINESEG